MYHVVRIAVTVVVRSEAFRSRSEVRGRYLREKYSKVTFSKVTNHAHEPDGFGMTESTSGANVSKYRETLQNSADELGIISSACIQVPGAYRPSILWT